ncbi:MAG TPA: NAD(P)-binding protein [Bryobacteraceae bacterium]|nr:NAD(P)-binding protein [Bryobacteraceae bacterium]
MADSANRKRKIAILGGGVGGMTTAFELTSVPGWQEQYEVTVYQLGWRLGGKGASGRNAHIANRIEEHGLHMWFGFYDNAFNVMRHVYRELAERKLAPDSPFQECFDAFEPHSRSTLAEPVGNEWKLWSLSFPPAKGLPGDDCLFDSKHPVQPPQPFDYVLFLMDWMVKHSDDHQRIGEQPADFDLPEWAKLLLEPLGLLAGASCRAIGDLLRLAHRFSAWISSDVSRYTDLHFKVLHHLLSAIHAELGKGLEDAMEHLDELRRALVSLDFILTLAKGLIGDDVVRRGFQVIDQYDFVEWLARHGSKFPNSAIVVGIYDACFAYEHGNPATPRFSAAPALHGNLRCLFTYHKAAMFRMKAAMGDTVFAPLYLVLRERGVKFEFFRRVENVGLSADGSAVDSVEMDIQATVKSGAYQPLIEVDKLPAWPNVPLYDQLVQGEEIRAGNFNLESAYTEWRDRIGHEVLRRGTDFDDIVLAMSIGPIPHVCKELLAASEKWRNMTQFVATTQTQAMQLWLTRTAEEMGWNQGMKFPADDRAMFCAFREPFDTYADFSQLIPREQWRPEDGLKQIAYLCNCLPDQLPIPVPFTDPGFPKRALDTVRENGRAFLASYAGVAWPAATDPPGTGPLDWNLLVTQGSESGEGRLDAQYFRANIDPNERYVLSLPGSAQYRLESDKSGFDHLYLAGDWTATDMNVGCVEAAVISGRMASRAICGYPRTIYCAFGGDVANCAG